MAQWLRSARAAVPGATPSRKRPSSRRGHNFAVNPNVFALLATAFATLAAASAHAQPAQVPPLVPAAAAPASAPHNHAAETRAIRARSLAEKVNLPPQELKQSCRFESDITTPPPAGLVSLSFDDGPEPAATPAILALLDKYQVPATFFLIAAKAQRHPELVAMVRAHPLALVGNHSWSHPNFHDIAPARQDTELQRSDSALAAIEAPKLFRYPYGNASCEANAALQRLGYRIVGWHVDSCDWAFDKTGSIDAHEAKMCGVDKADREHFVDHVVNAVKARHGGIVLMHEIHPNTLAKLDTLIARLLAEGFRFAPLTDAAFQPSLR